MEFRPHPAWAWNFFTKEKFDMPHLSSHVEQGTNVAVSVGEYFSSMLDPTMSWKDAERALLTMEWTVRLEGIMSVEDAKRAVDIGCTGIMVSNHGGRQLDGSRAPFDQLAEICDAVGDQIDVVCRAVFSEERMSLRPYRLVRRRFLAVACIFMRSLQQDSSEWSVHWGT